MSVSQRIVFLAKDFSEICQKWEKSYSRCSRDEIRVVNTRFGVVLTPKGGILQKLLSPFKLISDKQLEIRINTFHWVSIEDVIKSIFYSITNTSIKGSG